MSTTSHAPGPGRYRDHESIPTFKCSTPECIAYAFDEDEHHQCDFCGQRFCADCLVKIEDLKACPACRVCAKCGDVAIVQCGACSGLVCVAHVSRCQWLAEAATEKRENDGRQIARAAHLFGSFEGWRARQICEEESIPGPLIAQGAELAWLEREEHHANCRDYGQPCYGSWPESSRRHQPIRMLLAALSRGEAQLINQRDRKSAASVEQESELERARR